MKKNILLFFAISLSIMAFAQSTDNPYKTRYGTAPIWTTEIRWEKTINILDFALPNQTSWDDALNLAKTSISQSGGGVIYFPAVTYIFTNRIGTLKVGMLNLVNFFNWVTVTISVCCRRSLQLKAHW